VADRLRAVAWSESAQTALDEVIAYIHQDSPGNARRVLVAALKAAASLETLAERGRIVPELGDPDIRELLVFRFRLLYRVSNDRVTVVAFLRGVRDFATWRKDQIVDE
jgi:plasmid stabilization system protein ParE